MIAVVEIAVDGRVSGSMEALTYRNDHQLVAGDVVLVPLGVRTVFGVVLSSNEIEEEDLPFSKAKLRAAGPPIQGLRLPVALILLGIEVARDTLTSISHSAGLILPSGIRDRLVSSWRRTDEPVEPRLLTALQQEVLRTVEDLQGELTDSKSKPIAAGALRALRALRAAGYVKEVLTVQPKSERTSLPEGLKLTDDENAVDAFLRSEGRRKPAQALTLMRLQGSEGVVFSPQEIKALSGVTDQTLKALIKSKLLQPADSEVHAPYPSPTLSPQQVDALASIQTAIRQRVAERFLLFGVTGSGKTEVYLHAAAEALAQGRQVLYLVPEIALTAQVISQLRGRFGPHVAVLHSNLSPLERLETWMRIARGEAPVVLGPRSALFAPLSNVGLIVLDEEHEQSYKQESHPRYHTKRLAKFLAEQHGAALVLGSATPSIETFWESTTGQLHRLEMPVRAATAQLPTIHVVDLVAQFKSGGKPSLFSEMLRTKMEGVLERQEQAILFLNRRAYAPYLGCRECGFVYRCPNCAVSLSVHKRDSTLVCHYCDYRVGVHLECHQCGGVRLHPTGAGVEKVEEALRNDFPTARIARLDRDVAKKKGALEEIMANMRAGEIDFLVGTQLVAKGLDFPGVTLVGVIAADTALHMPDFRSSERTFQLLTQVAGRAGRGQKLGEVVIQTFSPDHPAVVHARDHEYLALYESLLEERETVGYPPFNRLVNILLTSENRAAAVDLSAALGKDLRAQLEQADVLGPSDCTIERLNNFWRRHLLVKLPLDSDLEPIRTVVSQHSHPAVTITVDVDPYTML